METLFKISGGLMIGLALLHAIFPGYFKWKEELRSITSLTRQVHYIHTFFIALTVFLMGVLCLCSSTELLTTSLGRQVCFGLFIFWFCRLMVQFFGYSSAHWKGKPFETAVHVVFSLLWTFFSAVFGVAAFFG
ncbi:MAG: hypothetical protein H7067_05105 [Burkholderiales bacterium]|nr:hypothetical protein [Opitutaceae bacterium]